jgi:hypothetical protein
MKKKNSVLLQLKYTTLTLDSPHFVFQLNNFMKQTSIPRVAQLFFLISQDILIERKRGATQSTQYVYKGKPKEKKISEKENPGN